MNIHMVSVGLDSVTHVFLNIMNSFIHKFVKWSFSFCFNVPDYKVPSIAWRTLYSLTQQLTM